MTTDTTTTDTRRRTMTAVVGRRYGPPDVLAIERVPTPTPRPARYSCRSPRRRSTRSTGTTSPARPTSCGSSPESDVRSGRSRASTSPAPSSATGPGVTGWRVGDAVFGKGDGGGCAPPT